MSDLLKRIDSDLKKALLERDEVSLSTLRMLRAALVNKEKQKRLNLSKKNLSPEDIEEKSKLSEEEVIEVISSEIKKRKESISAYEKGNRKDLVREEKRELEILKKYLPEQLSLKEIEKMAKEVIKDLKAKDIKDMGKVMKELMPRLKGRADGKLVSEIVKSLLTK